MKKFVRRLGIFLIILGLVFPPSTVFAAEENAEGESSPAWEYVDIPDTADIEIERHSTVTLNGLIYIIGGLFPNNLYSTRTTVYNPKTNELHSAGEMTDARGQFGCVVYQGKIYSFGGAGNSKMLNTVEVFDPKTETWSMVNTVMPVEKYGFGTAVVGDKIYIIGGYNYKKTGICTVDIYDPQTNTWTSGASTPYPGINFGCAVIQGKIYTFGGQTTTSNMSATNYSEISCYDPAIDKWSSAGKLPRPIVSSSVSLYNNKAIITGGKLNDAHAYYTSITFIYDPVSQTCTEAPSLQTYRSMHTSEIVDDIIYVICGQLIIKGYTSTASTIEKLDLTQLLPPPPVSDNLTVLLNTGESVQLSVSSNLADNANLTWSSSDSSIARVDENGKVRAVAPGTCSIAAENTGDEYQEFIPVKVFDGNADQYRLAVSLLPEQTTRLHLTEDPTSTTWTSHDTAVATVNTSGVVTAVSNGLVIVEGEANSKSHHIYVRVKA